MDFSTAILSSWLRVLMVLVSVLLLSLMLIGVVSGIGGIVVGIENIDTVLRNHRRLARSVKENTESHLPFIKDLALVDPRG